MKRCAECGKSYADEYDGCPECTSLRRQQAGCSTIRNIGCAVVGAVGLLYLLASCAVSGM